MGGSGSYRLAFNGATTAAIASSASTSTVLSDLQAINTIGAGTVAVNGTSGTFTLTYGGTTTAALSYNASAAAVQAALQSLPSLGTNVLVTSTNPPGTTSGDYVITFTGALAGTAISNLTAASAGGASVFVGSDLSVSGSSSNYSVTFSTGLIGDESALTTNGGASSLVSTSTLSVSSNANLGASGGGLMLGGTLQATATFATARSVILSSPTTIDVTSGSNLTISGVISNSGNLTKTDAGTLTLTGTNSYTGSTTVAAGTLAGTGSIAGSLSVASGATLAPGNSTGTFSIGGNATFAAGSTLQVNLNGTSAGQFSALTVTGTATLGGATLAGTVGFTPARAIRSRSFRQPRSAARSAPAR